jgi:hypothetical protein
LALRSDSKRLISIVLDKDWEELEAIEQDGGRLLFPFSIQKKTVKGWEAVPVMLRVPREADTRRARSKAREWAKREKLDPELDPELFSNMDTMCMLADAIRNVAEPHEPWEPFPDKLEELYDRPSLDAVVAYIDALKTTIDPRPHDISEEETWGVIAAVAKARNIVPLAAFAGESQNNCVVTMATELMRLRQLKSS